jgi:hypothetical protein
MNFATVVSAGSHEAAVFPSLRLRIKNALRKTGELLQGEGPLFILRARRRRSRRRSGRGLLALLLLTILLTSAECKHRNNGQRRYNSRNSFHLFSHPLSVY